MRAVLDAATTKMPKFVPRQRKHKVLARRKTPASDTTVDANATEILPQEEQERAQKKAALKDELTRESQGKMSGKKKKRLDKYIVRGKHFSHSLCAGIAP
jgi:ATP-dependent RNA helicase DHX37/DHR1